MSQILLWTSFLEIFGGIALFQTIQGKRYPGDFQFDPLGLSQVCEKDQPKVALEQPPAGRLPCCRVIIEIKVSGRRCSASR